MNIGILVKVLHTLEQLRKHEQWTRPQLAVFQIEALCRLRDFAYAHSPFYQRFHKGLMDRPLHELPVLTKAMMVEHFDEVLLLRQAQTIRGLKSICEGRFGSHGDLPPGSGR